MLYVPPADHSCVIFLTHCSYAQPIPKFASPPFPTFLPCLEFPALLTYLQSPPPFPCHNPMSFLHIINPTLLVSLGHNTLPSHYLLILLSYVIKVGVDHCLSDSTIVGNILILLKVMDYLNIVMRKNAIERLLCLAMCELDAVVLYNSCVGEETDLIGLCHLVVYS